MTTHQIPFQDANQIAGFIYHHADHVALRMGTLHNKEGAVKMHTLLDDDSLLPEFVNITDGKCGDNRGALYIPVSPHSVVVADCGYCDFSLLSTIGTAGMCFLLSGTGITCFTHKLKNVYWRSLKLPWNPSPSQR